MGGIEIPTLILMIIGGIVSYLFWQLKRYIVKVDDLENRVITIETVIGLLGDIKEDLHSVKTDVEVIKSKLS